jgi:hypothetical protein
VRSPVDRLPGPLALRHLQLERETLGVSEAVGHVLAGSESEPLQCLVQREGAGAPQPGADDLLRSAWGCHLAPS